MAVTFFENQQNAKRKTFLLLVLYSIAVLAIILGIYLGLLLVLHLASFQIGSGDLVRGGDHYEFHAGLFLLVCGFTILFILLGSAYKVWQLSKGGATVARMLGGRLITHDTTDSAERKILNIVDEMAIASGIAVPPVYLMDDEHAINAFAAGFKPSSAVIGVSRGAIDQLTRDELQGVVAHEFSHIFNGDMALNIRLMGILHGILVIAMSGYMLMRITGRSRGRREGNGQALALGVGVVLMVIGYTGVFAARLIKMAVSRQREYLADASAVQFTRNPHGIGNALRRILAYSEHGYMNNEHAEEVSHMFFSDGVRRMFGSYLATHPPLKKRISAIASLAGGLEEPLQTVRQETEAAPKKTTEKKSPLGVFPLPGMALPGMEGMAGFLNNESSMHVDQSDMLQQVGTLSSSALIHAQELINSLPSSIAQLSQEPCGAIGLVYYVLLDANPEVRHKQTDIIADTNGVEVQRFFLKLYNQGYEIKQYQRLPLLDLCLPTLKLLSKEQYVSVRNCVEKLIHADDRVSLFEFCLEAILLHSLDRWYETAPPRKSSRKGAASLLQPVSKMLFALSFLCNKEADDAYASYTAGADHCGIHEKYRLSPSDAGEVSVLWLEEALPVIDGAGPDLKQAILRASHTSVSNDGKVTIEEYELLRAIASILECPLPPLAGLSTES